MPPKVNTQCLICKVKSGSRDLLKCIICKGHFCANVKCAQITEKVFGIMTKERKDSWKCRKCRQSLVKDTNKTTNSSTSTPINTEQILQPQPLDSQPISEKCSPICTPLQPNVFLTPPSHRLTPELSQENITYRKKYVVNIPTDNTFSSLDDDDCDEGTTQRLSRSYSEILQRTRVEEETEEMKKKIGTLEENLLSADNEIENLLSENNFLKKRLKECESKIQHLMTICRSTDKEISAKNNSKRKQRRKTLNFSLVDSAHNPETQDIPTEPHFPSPNNINNSVCTTIEDQSNTSINNDEERLHTDERKMETDATKICLISSTSRDVLLMSERILGNARLFHYKLNQGGICRLMENLESKLENYTLSDFCVIFIGEPDFETTQDYKALVELIRNKLEKVQNTNIILCLPCFKCNDTANLFNRRIETFNSLLHKDNAEFKYVFLLDTNRNMEYSHTMFSMFTGKVNRKGMATIITDLKHLIACITQSYIDWPLLTNNRETKTVSTLETANSRDGNQFFRL